jgi:hypothetical protein
MNQKHPKVPKFVIVSIGFSLPILQLNIDPQPTLFSLSLREQQSHTFFRALSGVFLMAK